MDLEVSRGKTIQKLDYDPNKPYLSYMADRRYLAGFEDLPDGTRKYHYARPVLQSDRVCHYHLIVELESSIIVGWGFDYEKGNPEEDCTRAGKV